MPSSVQQDDLKIPAAQTTDGLATLDGQDVYRICDVDAMPPFLMSIVSDSDHWMYISSRGALTCGRISDEHTLFPYETDDKLHFAHAHTGPFSLLRITRDGQTRLWEPFAEHADRAGFRRNLYKSLVGNQITFEEINADLGLTFRYRWANSDRFGFVRTVTVENHGAGSVTVELVDGLRNLMPSGVELGLQRNASCLVNAYTRADVDSETALLTLALSALVVDKAQPVESLTANILWTVGLDRPTVLLSSDQLGAFRRGAALKPEPQLKGRRACYLVHSTLQLSAGESRSYDMIAELDKGQVEVEALRHLLLKSKDVRAQIKADVDAGTASLIRNVAASDGLQSTGDAVACAHHFANVLFNNMRGGVFATGYVLPGKDFAAFLRARNVDVAQRHAALLDGLPETLNYHVLLELAAAKEDADLLRLAREYLPLSFGRRHGEPSRPWNRFNIRIKNSDGTRALNYQGNWRDIFQNWESLSLSFPDYVESILSKFVNATTVDGFNPYRVTRDGIDWETPNPEDPWSNIGYWGDHQIIYLLKFLEMSHRYHPGALEKLLAAPQFSYAYVPYRLKPYESLVANPRDTIQFDKALNKQIEERAKQLGADGKLLPTATGAVYHVTLAEKILVPILSKLANLVPDGGIWMNTQRPEWNDANNALVGNGISMVTLCYLRRHLAFCSKLFRSVTEPVNFSAEVRGWLDQTHAILKQHRGILAPASINDRTRREVLDALGQAFSSYRQRVYASGFSGTTPVNLAQAADFFDLAIEFLDHAIRANRRPDGLYHAYNLLDLAHPGEARVAYLYAMLEGQVAVLSAGTLSPDEAIAVIEALFKSDIYRPDQSSFMLYPERELPSFLQKNRIPAADVEGNPLLAKMLEAGDTRIVARDAFGQYRFNSRFRTTDDLDEALTKLDGNFTALASAHKAAVHATFERVFNLRGFTGRSGTMYGYEGLGCIYWHMVAKLLLATQEYSARARTAKNAVAAQRLHDLYYAVRTGLGFNKDARRYGAVPTDPYSHTPKHAGAQQPGMTGQVKEEILTRWGEMGVVISKGQIMFDPSLLLAAELDSTAREFRYFDPKDQPHTLQLKPGQLAFTLCQVPVIYQRAAGKPSIAVIGSDNRTETVAGSQLSAESSRQILSRTGKILRIEVQIP